MSFCRGHQVLAEAQKELPQDKDGRPLPGFMVGLRPPPDDDEAEDG